MRHGSPVAEQVWHRAGGRCEYCRMDQAHDELTFEVEHIISRKHGGQTVLSNLCLACFSCNRYKGSDIAGRDALTGKLVPLFHPRRKAKRDIPYTVALFRGLGPKLAEIDRKRAPTSAPGIKGQSYIQV